MNDCIFCRIIAGEISSNKRAESAEVLAFDDVSPSADTHILIVPKKHIGSFLEIKNDEIKIVLEMIETIQKLISQNNLQDGYKIAVNGGKYQHVPHLHWHLLAGKIKSLPQ